MVVRELVLRDERDGRSIAHGDALAASVDELSYEGRTISATVTGSSFSTRVSMFGETRLIRDGVHVLLRRRVRPPPSPPSRFHRLDACGFSFRNAIARGDGEAAGADPTPRRATRRRRSEGMRDVEGAYPTVIACECRGSPRRSSYDTRIVPAIRSGPTVICETAELWDSLAVVITRDAPDQHDGSTAPESTVRHLRPWGRQAGSRRHPSCRRPAPRLRPTPSPPSARVGIRSGGAVPPNPPSPPPLRRTHRASRENAPRTRSPPRARGSHARARPLERSRGGLPRALATPPRALGSLRVRSDRRAGTGARRRLRLCAHRSSATSRTSPAGTPARLAQSLRDRAHERCLDDSSCLFLKCGSGTGWSPRRRATLPSAAYLARRCHSR